MRGLGVDFPKCWFAFEVNLKQTDITTKNNINTSTCR